MADSNEDVLEMLDSLEKESKAAVSSSKKKQASSGAGSAQNEDDIMGFLDSLTKNPTSGKSSPALAAIRSANSQSSSTTANQSIGGGEEHIVNGTTVTESSSESSSSTANTPPPPESGDGEGFGGGSSNVPDPILSITSWWSRNKGGLWDTATSAVKQAEARVKEFQPEVQQSQQRALESIGGGISRLGISRGLLQSTLSSVLETIAPPISRHEQLKINIFHDMVGYPAIDSIVYGVFERVMQQVEGGGDLTMIVQKGKERHRRGSDAYQQRELGIFKGSLDQGIKLASANIEDFVRRSQEGISNNNKEEQKNSNSSSSGSSSAVNEDRSITPASSLTSGADTPIVRVSDIFLSIQPASLGQQEEAESPDSNIISVNSSSTFVFIIYLYDPNNDIKFSSISQPFPYQWAEWLDSPDSAFKAFEADPREWVIDWVEEGLGLAVGIAAQSYVAKRMGIESLFTVTKKVTEDATVNGDN